MDCLAVTTMSASLRHVTSQPVFVVIHPHQPLDVWVILAQALTIAFLISAMEALVVIPQATLSQVSALGSLAPIICSASLSIAIKVAVLITLRHVIQLVLF